MTDIYNESLKIALDAIRRDARNAALEEAAKAAEKFNAELYRDLGDGSWRPGQPAVSDGCRIAAAIRALKDKP